METLNFGNIVENQHPFFLPVVSFSLNQPNETVLCSLLKHLFIFMIIPIL